MNYTHLEDDIKELYTTIGITTPIDLTMRDIATKLGVTVSYRSSLFRYKNEIVIAAGSEQEEWQAFGHEVCHYLRHCGNQLILPRLFIDLQEWQADYFAYHFCVPTFMLEKMELAQHQKENIWNICNTFNVDYEFASKRLDMYQNKQKQLLYQQEYEYAFISENQHTYSTEQIYEIDFNLDNEILPEEFYEFHDLSTNRDSKVQGTIQFIKDMRVRGLL